MGRAMAVAATQRKSRPSSRVETSPARSRIQIPAAMAAMAGTRRFKKAGLGAMSVFFMVQGESARGRRVAGTDDGSYSGGVAAGKRRRGAGQGKRIHIFRSIQRKSRQ